MKNARGFTLIELMVTLAVFAIVTALAFPGFRLYQQNSARVTNINDLIGALNLARTEAVKRGVDTIVCASTNANVVLPALPGCSGVDDWTTGWIAFMDADSSGGVTAGDTIILTHGALSGANVTFHDDDGITPLIRYTSAGRAVILGTTNIQTATFMRCDDRFNTDPVPNQHARAVIVGASGRVRVSRNDDGTLDANNIHEGFTGASLSCP